MLASQNTPRAVEACFGDIRNTGGAGIRSFVVAVVCFFFNPGLNY